MLSSRHQQSYKTGFPSAPAIFVAVIISILTAAVQSPCQTSDVESVLRRRMTAYWEAMQRGDYEVASNYIHPDSRKVFIFRTPKGPILRWRIEKLTFNADKTVCDTMSMVARPIPIADVKDVPDFPIENQWLLLPDGEWYLKIPWKEGENPLLQLYKGAEDANAPLVMKGDGPPAKTRLGGEEPGRLQPDPANPTILHRGEKAIFRYQYRNSGEIPLKIFSAHGDCHCTAVQQEHPVVPPGGSAFLEITVDTFGLPYGETQKLVSVKFSDTEKPETLAVRFTNKPNFVITPPLVDFGTIKKGSPVEKKVQILNESGQKVKFLAVLPYEPRLSLSYDKAEIGPGETLVITIRCDPSETGEFVDSPMLRTDLAAEPLLNVSIRGRIIS
jgi:hypothetical protein